MPQGLLNQLQQLIFTDDLTGLYNRRYMHFIMREASAKGSFTPMSLLVLDLDRFKTINDTHGHADGDVILKQLARILTENVPSGQTIVRFGGDEFIIILQNIAKAQALEIGEAIRKTVAKKPFQLTKANQEVRLSVSVGCASAPDDAKDFQQLFEEADKALYFSKKTGRGRVTAAGKYDPAQVLDRTVHEQLGHPALVNRVAEMDAVKRSLQECNQGQPRFMLISGEAGSGKSRVLRETLQLAKEKDMIYVFTRCAEYYSPSPYRVLINLVQVFSSRHPETIKPQLAQLSDEVYTTVCEVIPGISKVAERDPQPLQINETQKRRYLFAALARIVWQLAQERSIVILVDNVHYIDQGTLEVIRWLLTARKAKILFLATVPVEVLSNANFKRSFVALFLEECSIEPYYTSMNLEPLSAADISALIRALLPQAPLTDAFVSMLVDMSRGNPLFVTSVIRYLLTIEAITLDQGQWKIGEIDRTAIPTSLEELLRKLFDSLDQEAVEFLTNAAVAGESFHIDTMRGSLDKNEGQLLDVVDKLMRQNLVDSSEPGQATDFEFLSQKARNVSYESIESDQRQRVHQKIGEVEEKRLEGNEEAADVLAHHFQKSGDAPRAQKYQQALNQRRDKLFKEAEVEDYQSTRPSDDESRLPEGNKKLDPHGLAQVGILCRNLINAVKISRVYPAGAPAVQQARQTLLGSMDDAFASAEIITLAQTEESIAVNGQEIPLTAFEGYAGQVRILFTEKYIKAFTMGRGINADELTAVVSALAAKVDPQQILSDDAYWAKKLDGAHVRRADIIPLVFVPESQSAPAEGDIDAALVEGIKGFLKSLKGSVEALRFYPPGSAVIRENIQNLLDASAKLFRHWNQITLAVVEGRFVVNTIPADEVRFGSIVNELGAMMGEKKLTSMTLLEGVTAADLDALTRGLFSKEVADEATLGEFVVRNGATKVVIGQVTVAMKTFGSQAQEAMDTRSPVEQAAQWIKMDDIMFTGDATLYQLVNLVDGLHSMSRVDLADSLQARYFKLVSHRDSGIAERAAEALDRLVHLGGPGAIKSASSLVRENALALLAPALPAKVRRHFVPMAVDWLNQMVQAQNWEGLAAHLEALKAQPETKLQENVADMLAKQEKNGQWGALYEAFKAPASRPVISRSIRVLGKNSEESLLRIIRESSDSGLIEATAALIKETNPDAWKPLLESVTLKTPVSEALNLLKALAVLARGRSELGILLASLIGHHEDAVRFEALKFADAADTEGAERVIRTALVSNHSLLVLQALTQAVSLKLSTLGEAVTNLFKNSIQDELITACCSYLRQFPRAESMSDLIRVFDMRPKLFGLKKGLKDSTRAAAILAIGSMKTPQADAVTEEALKDKSMEVRSAARSVRPREETGIRKNPDAK